jgi:hypothetical protein
MVLKSEVDSNRYLEGILLTVNFDQIREIGPYTVNENIINEYKENLIIFIGNKREYLNNVFKAKAILRENSFKNVFITDMYLLGTPGIFGVLQCVQAALIIRRNKHKVFFITADSTDPQPLAHYLIVQLFCQSCFISRDLSIKELSDLGVKECLGLQVGISWDYEKVKFLESYTLPLKNRKSEFMTAKARYEPRKKFITILRNSLVVENMNLEEMPEIVQHKSYLTHLSKSKFYIQTNFIELNSTNPFMQKKGITKHVVFGNIEGLIAGCLVFAQFVDGLEEYFRSDEHLIYFNNVEELVNKMRFYSNNLDLASEISLKGKARAFDIIKNTNLDV